MRSTILRAGVVVLIGSLSTACAAQAPIATGIGSGGAERRTIKEHLEGQFEAPVARCLDEGGLKKFRKAIGGTEAKSFIPKEVREGLFGSGSPGDVVVTQLPDAKIYTLFASPWEAPKAGSSAVTLHGKQQSLSRLPLTPSTADDRQVFTDSGSVMYTHNCSTVIGAALEAKAKLDLPIVEAGLKGGYNRTDGVGVSLIAGTFTSPFAKLISPPATGQTADHAALLETNLGLWDWYGQDANRVEGAYSILGSFQGVALYRTEGATWATKASADSSLNFVVGSTSTTGTLKVNGEAAVTRFVVLAKDSATPDFRPMPDLKTVVSRVGQYASSIPREDQGQSLVVVDQQPLSIAYRLPLNSALCTSDRIKKAPNGPDFTVSWQKREPSAASFCRLTRTFQPTAQVPVNFQHPAMFQVLLTSDTLGAAGDITLTLDREGAIPDARGAYTVRAIASEEDSFVFKDGQPAGSLKYRVSKKQGSLDMTGASWDLKSSCSGENNANELTAGTPTMTPDGPRAVIISVPVPRLQSEQLSSLRQNGGECSITGTVEMASQTVGGSPVVLTLEPRRIRVARDPIVAGKADTPLPPPMPKIALPRDE
jgi:hypothetical protein